ncbi:hypothetical protein G443_003429 [Actinoalloteichus cyanogriseus DSM 43889]|uniref:Uncharacterized protein n=1 Tax=Actinoalloteichus caeruleus DSM 43889 TaxID=1120930 RepID=A0ABT1JKW9_ACTCY|nr:hypothetical protein [Actinoalloteichus caeruleus DSM 43889]
MLSKALRAQALQARSDPPSAPAEVTNPPPDETATQRGLLPSGRDQPAGGGRRLAVVAGISLGLGLLCGAVAGVITVL